MAKLTPLEDARRERDEAQRDALRPWRAQALVNARGLQVGQRCPVFRLKTP